jgi:hypothetical protein
MGRMANLPVQESTPLMRSTSLTHWGFYEARISKVQVWCLWPETQREQARLHKQKDSSAPDDGHSCMVPQCANTLDGKTKS